MTNLERQRNWRSKPENMKKIRKGQAARKASLKAAGLCAMCGQSPSVTGLSYCENCKSQSVAYQRQRRRALAAKGLCERCGQEPLPNSGVCDCCYFKKVSLDRLGATCFWKDLRDKLVAQDYRCAYTGTPLILGVNASVDHILPLSRYPEHANDPLNVEWVERSVNEMKRDRTPDEFIAILNTIINHRLRVQALTSPVAECVA